MSFLIHPKMAVRSGVLLLLAGLCSPHLSAAKTAPAPAPAPPLLPVAFAGWQQTGKLVESRDPAAADAGNADVLKDYGFQRFVAATYVGGGSASEDTVNVRAIQFPDATGAYGAFTFYQRPGMGQEQIGSGAAFDGVRVLFWQANILVDAQFSHITAMSASEMRELADALPKPPGNASIPPALPGYLPPMDLLKNTARYTLGAASYAKSGGALPPSLINFDTGAEVLTAQYSSRRGDGTLTILSYPTPQLAAERERAITTFLQAGNSPQAEWPQALAESAQGALAVHRSGPLVSVAYGGFSAEEAQRRVHMVHYQADITWNHPQGYVSDASKAARLYLGIAALVGMIAGAALIIGIFLGGGRALIRVLRGKSASSVDDAEFIRLDLR